MRVASQASGVLSPHSCAAHAFREPDRHRLPRQNARCGLRSEAQFNVEPSNLGRRMRYTSRHSAIFLTSMSSFAPAQQGPNTHE